MKQCCKNCQLFYRVKTKDREYAWCCIYELHQMRFFDKEEYQVENECEYFCERFPFKDGVEFVIEKVREE